MPNLTGWLTGYAGPTSQFYTTPYPHALGDRAHDKDGNEYVFCQFDAVGYNGQVVQLTADHHASPLLGTIRVAARVGVVVGGMPTTDNVVHLQVGSGGWVQIYGLNQQVQTGAASSGLTSDNTVAYIVVPQTSVGTPSGVMSVLASAGTGGTSISQTSIDTPRIYGMWVVPDAFVSALVTAWPSSATSGPSSEPTDPSVPTSATATSFDNTSAFIGQVHVCYLNYPYVTGVEEVLGAASS